MFSEDGTLDIKNDPSYNNNINIQAVPDKIYEKLNEVKFYSGLYTLLTTEDLRSKGLHVFDVVPGSPSIEFPVDYSYQTGGSREIRMFVSNSESFVLMPPANGKLYLGNDIVHPPAAIQPVDIGQNFILSVMPVFNDAADVFAEFAILNSSVPLHIVGA